MFSSTNIILIVIVVGIIIFAIVSAILSSKNQKLEKKKRKKEVIAAIKKFLKEKENLTNIKVNYKKVVARKGKDYKYRDIFDVIIDIKEAKLDDILFTRAYEIEGVSKKISKKEFSTTWVVNRELDLDFTESQIAIAEKKVKLTKEEQKERRQLIKDAQKKAQESEQQKRQETKKNKKADLSKPNKKKGSKFVPPR